MVCFFNNLYSAKGFGERYESVFPIVLRPYKFSKSRPIKYRILAISHQK